VSQNGSRAAGYVISAGLGAVAAGLIVVVATRAIPKIMSGMMSEMMRNMMSGGQAGGCSPAET